MEQTLLTDQDNAIVFDDAGAPRRAWFQALGDRANADLEAAGFPQCPGGYMARHWNAPLSEWVERFRGWTEVPNPEALLVASIFFDFRAVAGALGLERLEATLAAARGKTTFLRLLASASMEHHPPPSFLMRLRGESSVVDLKAHGVSPVVFLARCFGLEAGTRARSTVERLQAAARAGLIAEEQHTTVVEAFRFVLGLRLRRQLEALSRRGPVSSRLALSELTAVERTRLKEAFRAIESWQEHAKQHYQTST
jgi:CBS domain-containing protein